LKAAGLPSNDQVAKSAENSNEYLPQKSVKGYKIEELNAKNESQSVINKSLWKWLVLILAASYSIFYFIRKRRKA